MTKLLLSCAVLALPAAAAAEAPEALVKLGEKVEARVVKLRGLDVKKALKWELTSKEKVRAYLLETLGEQYGPGELEAEADAFKALGLIPADMKYREFMISLFEEQAAGYYDPKRETFYLADWIPPALQESILSHELTHALQDQHFDIDKFLDRIRGDTDAMFARQALVEGEATLVMMMDAMGNMGVKVDLSTLDLDGPLGKMMMQLSASQMPAMASAPQALQEILLFPYIKGLSFVIAGKQRGGWATIDKAYADLPVTTEQILHPEKYFAKREPAVDVSLDFLKGTVPESWKEIYDDVLGEFLLQLVLEDIGDSAERKRAAAGWGGDHLKVFKRGEELGFVLVADWDTERDATEFAGAFAKTVADRAPGFTAEPPSAKPRMTWKGPDDRAILVERRARRVLVVHRMEGPLAERISAKTFQGHAKD